MPRFYRVIVGFLALLVLLPAHAAPTAVPERILGKADAPVTVDEYISLTCPHCAEFYTKTLPELEKRYIDTGKVRFILHDFPLDGTGLKAAALARCMPEDEFYPFIKVLYENQTSWAVPGSPDTLLIQYAQLGGLSKEKAEACLNDKDMQTAIITERTEASDKLGIDSTPTFVIDKSAATIKGAQDVNTFATAFDLQLAKKK